MAYIQKIGSSPVGEIGLCYCTSSASTSAKVSTTTTIDTAFDSLIHGMTIRVKFTYANTATSPTFNLNGTGAKPIFRYGTTYPGTTVATSWNAYEIVSLTYDSTYSTTGCWRMNNWNTDINTHYTASLLAGTSSTSSNNSTYNPYLVLRENNSTRSNIRILGNGDPTSDITACTGGLISKSNSGIVTLNNFTTNSNSCTGAETCSLPIGLGVAVSDIVIVVNINNQGVRAELRLPYIALSKIESSHELKTGYFQETTYGGVATFQVTGGTITLKSAYLNNVNKTSTTTWSVYYNACAL